jgi:hypothetical protein
MLLCGTPYLCHEIRRESVHIIQLMKKSRGGGLVYRPTYIVKRTGERKTASTWWVQYFVGNPVSRVIELAQSTGGRSLSAGKAAGGSAGKPGRPGGRKSDIRGSREDSPR